MVSELDSMTLPELESALDQLRTAFRAEFAGDVPDEQKSRDVLYIEGIEASRTNIAADRKKKGDALISDIFRVESRIKVLKRAGA
jgi:hypothetical protein